MDENPIISVVMSVYNGEKYLKKAIDSVIRQTFEEYEHSDKRIKVITNEVNLKLPSSLNKAVLQSRGRYIARMDADDICLSDRLEKQYNFMEENPDVAISSCKFMTLKNGSAASGGCGGKTDNESVKALLLVTNPVLHPGIIAKAEVIKKLKYDTSLTCTEDLELWTRAVRQNYKIEIMDEYLMLYRIHDKQITGMTLKKQYEEVLKIQKKYFPEFFGTMSDKEAEFYIHGIYFREQININQFRNFKNKLISVVSKNGFCDKEAAEYAAFEILAEYKRCKITKKELVKGLLCFSPILLIKEIFGRRKRARNDGLNCIRAAENMGLIHSGGRIEFPSFSGAAE